MKSASDREKEFREALKGLLVEFDADMEITDDQNEWNHSPVVRITMNAVWDDDGELQEDFSEFEL